MSLFRFKNRLITFSFILGVSGLSISGLTAQNTRPDNWFTKDPLTENVYGVGSDRLYNSLLKGKPSTTVIVAVIDSGVDFKHEDLKDVMWTNPGEIPGNGIDDDKNGYIDDIHGWNFIGGKNGENVYHDNLEVTRVYKKYKDKYQNSDTTKLSGKEKKEYRYYKDLEGVVEKAKSDNLENYEKMKSTVDFINAALNAVEAKLGDKKPTLENINAIEAGSDQNLMIGKNILGQVIKESEKAPESMKEIKDEVAKQFDEGIKFYKNQVDYNYNVDMDTRKIVGDNYNDASERYYGNADCKGPDASHGTHVAGIIGAKRGNNIGIDGIADNVRIMAVRAVPDGDERDKDVANAIRYAVDNGAKVINMSFGKSYSWNKEAVDAAVKYAADHDVLLIHAAGNSGKLSDPTNNFPNPKYEKSGLFKPKNAGNWIEVGANSWQKDKELAANFSNYGKTNVDLFAPGVEIKSTVPDNGYAVFSGTSMAAPSLSGVAALLRSYFPSLTAKQVKEILETSVVKIDQIVVQPGSGKDINFSELSKTGGVVSAYQAVQAAMKIKGADKAPKAADQSKVYRP